MVSPQQNLSRLNTVLSGDSQSHHQVESLASPEICLLTIFPGEWDDDICCKREWVRLEDRLHFEALSYAWGDPTITRSIVVGNEDFEVTLNLESALRRLRKKSHERVIWIDQICINQKDEVEKSKQVGLMAEIYEAAQRVFIWLGDDEETSGTGFKAATRSVEQAEETEELGSDSYWHIKSLSVKMLQNEFISNWEKIAALLDFIRRLANNDHLENTPYLPDISQASHLSVLKDGAELLLQRRWWNRVWVIQETLLATKATVILGSWTLPWESFVSAAINFYRHLRSCCSHFSKLDIDGLQRTFHGAVWTIAGALTPSVQNLPPEDSFLHLLWTFRSREATDDRDKVFGLLSLEKLTPSEHRIVPNYSLDTLQLYMQVVERHIKAATTLHSLVNLHPGRPEFPSWLPDWAAVDPHFHWSYSTNRNSFYTLYRAWRSQDKLEVTISDRVLRSSGILVDTVCQVGVFNSLSSFAAINETLATWRVMARLDQETDKKYIDGGGWEEAFARTLIGDIILPQDRLGYRRAQPIEWKFFQSWYTIRTGAVKSQDRDTEMANLWDAAVKIASQNRAFFLTREGFMGTGPPHLAEGDAIYVLHGSNVPFLLRPFKQPNPTESKTEDDDSSYFTMVGDCYCHGFMDGEAIEKFPERMNRVSII